MKLDFKKIYWLLISCKKNWELTSSRIFSAFACTSEQRAIDRKSSFLIETGNTPREHVYPLR